MRNCLIFKKTKKLKTLTKLVFTLVIVISLCGCGIFQNPTKTSQILKSKLEDKYGVTFADLKEIRDINNPERYNDYLFYFETYPIGNDEETFVVQTSKNSTKNMYDSYFWYLVKDEYTTSVTKLLDDELADSGYRYYIDIKHSRNNLLGDEVSKDITLDELLNMGNLEVDVTVYVYKENSTKSEFLDISYEIENIFQNMNTITKLYVFQTYDENGFDSVVEKLKENKNYWDYEVRKYLNMDYFNYINYINSESSVNNYLSGFSFVNE